MWLPIDHIEFPVFHETTIYEATIETVIARYETETVNNATVLWDV